MEERMLMEPKVAAYCGIDVGTQGVRVVVMDERGRRLSAGRAPIRGGYRRSVYHEQHPESWWTALVQAVRAALVPLHERISIEAIALDATSGTVLVEDSNGRPKGSALMYDDGRASTQGTRARAVGNDLWDALGYQMQDTWALPKALWLLETGAASVGDQIVHQSDHLLRRLAGTSVPTDTSHALKTGVDSRTGQWPDTLFKELGIELSRLPEVASPGDMVGSVGREAAHATGLLAGTPIRLGMTDGCAAQIAGRALHAGSWSSNLGTTLVLKGSHPTLVRDPHGTIYCHRNPDGGWLPGGASNTGAGVLAQRFPQLTNAELTTLAAGANQFIPTTGVTYALAAQGERFPFAAPTARGFLAPEANSDPACFAALCLSVAYIERLAYETLAELGANIIGPISLCGGASQNAWWNQLRTDVLGQPTLVPESVEPANGMAILAASPPGQLAATADRMVRISKRLQPDSARGRALRPGYDRLVEELVSRGWLTRRGSGRGSAERRRS